MKNKAFIPLLMLAFAGSVISPAVFKKVVDDNALYNNDDKVVSIKKFYAPDTRAATKAPSKMVIHYHNDDGNTKDRTFWIWRDGVNGTMYDPQEYSADGKDMTITLDFEGENSILKNKKGIFFIVRPKSGWTGQSENVFVDFEEFAADANGCVTLWCIPGEGNAIEKYATEAETKMDRAVVATFTDWKTIKVLSTIAPTSYKVYAYTANYYKLNSFYKKQRKEEYLLTSGTVTNTTDTTYNSSTYKEWNIKLNYDAHINVQYSIETVYSTNPDKWMIKSVGSDQLYSTERFKRYYEYSGNDLGVTYTPSKTTFKVWAPTACRIMLLLYNSGIPSDYDNPAEGRKGDDAYLNYDMSFQKGGVWELSVTDSDLNGKYFGYLVYNSLGQSIVVDPYAKACNVNGTRGMVCDFSKTNPTGWTDLPLKWDGTERDIDGPNRLAVYESHIRDLTIDKSWVGVSKRGTYAAYKEKGTRLAGDSTITTGFDHIEELGVNAVQLLPVFDQDNDEVDTSFNWGYNPLNYNCVEGSYSANPFDGAKRIKEFKELVLAYANNANKTRIIMDVVYNHVASAPASNFTKLMPKYYFRYASDGSYYNGSGCGNEVKTEAPMMRKFIVESLCWWASEYKIKGFRFDLMGLIDCETLKQAATELYKIDPDIVMYGEGWRGDGDVFHGEGLSAETWNVYRELYGTKDRVAVGGFNDRGRNALRGANDTYGGSHLPQWGYMQQGAGDASVDNRNAVADMLWGIYSGEVGANPSQTVNYASCHDNWTLFDQLYYTLGNNNAPSLKRVCDASVAAESFIMMTNGIAFMQGGEEIFRSKEIEDTSVLSDKDTFEDMYGHKISHNSYNSPDSVNSYKWGNKVSITRDGDTVNTKSYLASLSAAVKLHISMPKFAFKDGQSFPYSHTSAGNEIWGTSWSGSEKGSSTSGSYHGACGFQLDEYFIFLAGRNWGWISFGDVPKSTKVFEFGPNEFDNVNGTVNVGHFDNNTGGAIVVYKRGK